MNGTAQQRIAGELTWQVARRAGLSVARFLLAGGDPDSIFGISASTIVDRLFCWLENIGVMGRLSALEGEGVKREAIPYQMYVILYFLRCLARIKSQNTLPDHLFSDLGLMQRVGFNAHDLEYGVTQRGAGRREGPRTNLPVDPEAMSRNVVKLSLPAVRDLLRFALRAIWASIPEVPSKLLVAVDGSFVEVGASAKGAGVTSRRKKVWTKAGVQEVTGRVVGFELVWLWVPALKLPLAVAFGKAEEDEKKFVPELLEEARRVLGERARIGTLVEDRGFLSGVDMWALNEAGIRFIVPARRDMRIHEEARRVAQSGSPGWTVHRQSRTETVPGKKRGEKKQKVTELVGVEGCRTLETYAPSEQVEDGENRRRYQKDFAANRLNAVVLVREDGREEPDLVLLTNGPVGKPFVVFDDYDERSLIENQGHRVLKQDWCLESPVQRTAKAAELHVRFVVLAYALMQGYSLWEEGQIEEEARGRTTTLGQYVRRLERENLDRILVFVGEEYGIYYTSEFMLLLGRRVLKFPNPRGAKTAEELLARLEREGEGQERGGPAPPSEGGGGPPTGNAG